MDEVKYNYIIESDGKIIGMFEDLGLTEVFMEAYFKKFYNEPTIKLEITRNIEGSVLD